MFSVIGLLLAAVTFSWEAPPSEQQVTKVEIRVANSIVDHDSGIIYDAGFPPVVNGRQEYTSIVDVATPKYGWIGFRNSFGVQEGSVLFLGKPQAPKGQLATP